MPKQIKRRLEALQTRVEAHVDPKLLAEVADTVRLADVHLPSVFMQARRVPEINVRDIYRRELPEAAPTAVRHAVCCAVAASRQAPCNLSNEQSERTKMTADIENLVLEHLRAIRADIAELKRETVASRVQIAAMGQQLGALTTAVYGGQTEMDALKHRVERIEQRLELVDHSS